MALYVYRCDQCGVDVEEFRTMDHRDDAPHCETCGEPMRRVPQAPPHRWVSPTGVELRKPGSEWNWPAGKPYNHAEFLALNPKSGAKLHQRKVIAVG